MCISKLKFSVQREYVTLLAELRLPKAIPIAFSTILELGLSLETLIIIIIIKKILNEDKFMGRWFLSLVPSVKRSYLSNNCGRIDRKICQKLYLS